MSMRLQDLLNNESLNLAVQISSIELDSRAVQPNSLFVALKGSKVDGRAFVDEAIAKGAQAVLLDAGEAEPLSVSYRNNIPLVAVPHLAREFGFIAARFYDYPAKKLAVLGVTGTNGKTSCTHFIAQALHAIGKRCGVVGTLGSGIYPHLGQVGLTTPNALDLQKILHDFVLKGAKAVAMEVSSHSIHQQRINGIDFDVGIFTNLTQDHLDYHGSMQHYAEVKRSFFLKYPLKHLVINADDSYGFKWIQASKAGAIYSYSTARRSRPGFKIDADHIQMNAQGLSAEIKTPWGAGTLHTSLIGTFNLSNVLAVLTALCLKGIDFEEVLHCIAHLHSAPGRMQKLGGEGLPLVVVDYAHTPDALQKTLIALRAQTQGKLICVFGCGGERDPGKRPIMAQIAESCADRVIVTNDNPRHEDPADIAKQISQGFNSPDAVTFILDRAKAIEKSLQYATNDDCVLIAGKGAEQYQQIGDLKMPFDDVSCAQQFLTVRGKIKCF